MTVYDIVKIVNLKRLALSMGTLINTAVSLTDTYVSPQHTSVHVNVKVFQHGVNSPLMLASAITGYIQSNHFPCWC